MVKAERIEAQGSGAPSDGEVLTASGRLDRLVQHVTRLVETSYGIFNPFYTPPLNDAALDPYKILRTNQGTLDNLRRQDLANFHDFATNIRELLADEDTQAVGEFLVSQLEDGLYAAVSDSAEKNRDTNIQKGARQAQTELKTMREARISRQLALVYDPDHIANVADVIADTSEDMTVPLSFAGRSRDGFTVSGSIRLTKSGTWAELNLPQFPDYQYGLPINDDLTGRLQREFNKLLKDNRGARESFYSHLTGQFGQQVESVMDGMAAHENLLTHIICDIINPNLSAQAPLAIRGFLPTNPGDSEKQAVVGGLLGQLEEMFSHQKARVVRASFQAEGAIVEGVRVSVEEGTYSFYIDRGRLIMLHNYSPDALVSTEGRIERSIEELTNVVAAVHRYFGMDVPSALVEVPAEYAKSIPVDFEVADAALISERMEHIGGYPPAQMDGIGDFVETTIAYGRGERTEKPAGLLLLGDTGIGKTTVTRAIARLFAQQDMRVMQLAATEKMTPGNFVRALRAFLRQRAGGVLVIEDAMHFFEGGERREVETARAALVGVLKNIATSPNHTLILNSERLERVIGTRGALPQAHRLNTVFLSLDSSPEGVEDLLRAVVAGLFSTGRSMVTKDSAQVNEQLARFFGKDGLAGFYQGLNVLTIEFPKVMLTPGMVDAVLRDMPNWQTTTGEEILVRLKERMRTKGMIAEVTESVQFTQLKEGMEGVQGRLEELTEEVEGLRQTVDGHDGAIGELREAVGSLAQPTVPGGERPSSRFGGETRPRRSP